MGVEHWNLVFAVLAFGVGLAGLIYQVLRDRAAGLPRLKLHLQRSAQYERSLQGTIEATSVGDRSWSLVGLTVLEPPDSTLDHGMGRGRTVIYPDAHIDKPQGIASFALLLLAHDLIPNMPVRLSASLVSADGRRTSVDLRGRFRE